MWLGGGTRATAPKLPSCPPPKKKNKLFVWQIFLTSFATNVLQNVTSRGINQKISPGSVRSIVLYPILKMVELPIIAMVS